MGGDSYSSNPAGDAVQVDSAWEHFLNVLFVNQVVRGVLETNSIRCLNDWHDYVSSLGVLVSMDSSRIFEFNHDGVSTIGQSRFCLKSRLELIPYHT